MNSMGCCGACTPTNSESLFPMGSYEPYRVGYGHTFGAYPSASRPTGITPVGMAGECAGDPVSRPCNWETATLGAYDRGSGNPDPYYNLPKMAPVGSFYSGAENPATFSPFGNYAGTGNPAGFNPVSGSENGSSPMNVGRGTVQPVGFLWPLAATLVGLAGVAGATWFATNTAEQALSPETVQYLGEPVVKTTGNLATLAVVGLAAYLIFRKDIEKALK